MTKPKYFFQGFDGALKVLQMMIYFPELRFLLAIDGEPIKEICFIEILYAPKMRFEWEDAFFMQVRTVNDQLWHKNLYLSKTKSCFGDLKDCSFKIFVAPESEAFFEDHESLAQCFSRFSKENEERRVNFDNRSEYEDAHFDGKVEAYQRASEIALEYETKTIYMPQVES